MKPRLLRKGGENPKPRAYSTPQWNEVVCRACCLNTGTHRYRLFAAKEPHTKTELCRLVERSAQLDIEWTPSLPSTICRNCWIAVQTIEKLQKTLQLSWRSQVYESNRKLSGILSPLAHPHNLKRYHTGSSPAQANSPA